MKKIFGYEDLAFFISVDCVQDEAKKRIDRKLTDSEMYSVKKGLEWCLLTEIDTVFDTAIKEAIS